MKNFASFPQTQKGVEYIRTFGAINGQAHSHICLSFPGRIRRGPPLRTGAKGVPSPRTSRHTTEDGTSRNHHSSFLLYPFRTAPSGTSHTKHVEVLRSTATCGSEGLQCIRTAHPGKRHRGALSRNDRRSYLPGVRGKVQARVAA